MNIKRLMGATALVGVLAGFPAIASAQTTPDQGQAAIKGNATKNDQAPDQAPAEIVVTGSRIARPNDNSTVPITSISGAELEQTGRVSIGDVLNDLPALQSTFSQANSTRFLGTAGLNLLDLRGLGTQRTLVLVNGRRQVGSDILNNAVSPDINTFPTDLIERVDVVTGGDSAIYGSDAIAGVVNFILKDHFEGLQLHAQGGTSQYGDAGSYYGSILAGKNFAEGRGNIAIDLEYARQNDLYASDRDYLSRNNSFVVVDTDPAGSPNGSDGNPDRVFFKDIRPATISSGGLFNVLSGANTVNGPGGTKIANPLAGQCGRDPTGQPYACTFIFGPDGSLVPQTGTRVGIAPNGSFIGGNGNTMREGQLVQILPRLDRYSANLIGHFDISDAFVPFIEAKYVRTDSFGTGSSGPAFFQGGTLDGFYEQPTLDNPYLSAQARGIITAQLQEADPTATITGDTRFALRRNLTDLGVRSEEAKRETYRAVLGIRGTFNDDWKYEVSGNYGEFDERTKVLGNLNVQRFLLGMDAVRGPNGQIVCGSQLDASRANDDFGGNPANLARDIAACQPINPFGEGNISQAAKNYVLQDTVSVGKITQFVGSAFVAGDSSKWFNLPGGPVGFSVGAEYRRETAFFQEDPLVESGYTFYNAIAKFDPPSFEVKEAYGELRLPILKDNFIHELTLTGAGRVADYKGSTGTVYAYNGGVDFAPIEDIRFRAAYARSVRAPNLSELYSPQSQNFAPGFADPCSARNIATGSQFRAANCASAGAPAGYDFVYQQSLEIISGGNPDLKAETSDSYTYGVVLQPRFVPGLTISVDYYNIKVNNVITAPSAQQIVNSCYDSPSLSNQFCALFQRNGTGAGPNKELPFQIIEGSLQQTLLNYAKLQVRGIDVDVAYRHRLSDTANISTHLVYTRAIQNDSFIDPTQPGFADQLLGELGAPKDAFNWNVDVTAGKFFINYQMRYIGKMVLNFYEDINSVQGRAPQNADYADSQYYPAVVYHNVRVGVDITKGSNFYVGIDNLTNTLPPFYSTGIGGGSGIYEPVGRRFYAGVNVRF